MFRVGPGVYAIATTPDYSGCAIVATPNLAVGSSTNNSIEATATSGTLTVDTFIDGSPAWEAFSVMITC